MITKQICYCEYCNASFVGEDSADECMKHESCHAKRIITDEIMANCVKSEISPKTIIPQSLVVPFSEEPEQIYAVYKLVRQYKSEKQGRAGECALQAAEEITKNDFFFKPDFYFSNEEEKNGKE